MNAAPPDPTRTGGIDWLEATRGHLTAAERRRARLEVAHGVGALARTRLALLLGRGAVGHLDVPTPPDSQLAAEAGERAAQQSPAVAGHSWRTWAYGHLLARLDRAPKLDEELFYVAAVLHDIGLDTPVPGEDFTLRSARSADEIMSPHCSSADTRRVQDAIACHCTPGGSLAADGPEGYYLQCGAALDLIGLRVDEIPTSTIGAINARYPRGDIATEIRRLIVSEARAVPHGRFAVLRSSGFNTTVRLAPKRLRAVG